MAIKRLKQVYMQNKISHNLAKILELFVTRIQILENFSTFPQDKQVDE